ncbi:UDP-Glycosyltransferase superfamily protein [Tripterygium wilfordii]|uniref:Glycosyltransferase n=1 Tax=Tripterygium wilfordii TaxID=458696 RepID=A0A7J7DVT5_TRIWF|nr:UDP-glycosyltransferase 86A1 [Tripterygium wilfordii]KAF5750409.1 UDP-Glycosyltransferase superfamily protein [Tripterygium wilfordii]
MKNNNEQRPHAILIPYPLQGHVNPFVHLAMKLASKGFTITFVNTHSIHHQITKTKPDGSTANGTDDIFLEARQSGLDIRYATISDGFPLGFDRILNHDMFWDGVLHVFSAHVDELVAKIVHSDPPLTCLIADTFFVWTSVIANKYNLVSVSFWTEPALVFTLYYHMNLLTSHGHFACHDKREDAIDYIPGVDPIEPKDMTSYLQATDVTTVIHRILYKGYEDVKRVDFVLVNTIQELESNPILALQENQPVYAIGPVFPTNVTKPIVGSSLWFESDCTQWLNTRPPGSVLYVSFGSYAHCTKNDVVEIAHGLSLSKVSFIWVLRADIVGSDEVDFLPVGFDEEVKERGLIVPWCCQMEVISHQAVGGFLTHCGWNSILESIWCGVPLLCFPLLTDQFTNRKLAVDDWKIGVNLCDKKLVTRTEMAAKINRLMCGKSGDEVRKNVKEVRKVMENALSSNGSSEENLNCFITYVKLKTVKFHKITA